LKVVGLTGSIGMGKSTTAAMFASEGVPVWDADAAVHRLYAPQGAAVAPVVAAFGDVADGAGGIDRQKLAARVLGDPPALARLESIVHPLVAGDRADFLELAWAAGHGFVVVDVPLLFETGAERTVDTVVVVTCAAEIQAQRVLARPGMTAERFEAILARQMPDARKRELADHLIDTGHGLDHAREQVRALVREWTPADGGGGSRHA
jgi:dephospho-CoA kinase